VYVSVFPILQNMHNGLAANLVSKWLD